MQLLIAHALDVSILAPAQGASCGGNVSCTGTRVSILAPAQGASYDHETSKGAYEFQFSPPHRGHQDQAYRRFSLNAVSILAPAQGASSIF